MTCEASRSTVAGVYASLSRLRRLWPRPLVADRAVAVLLTAVAELEIWLGGDLAGHRLVGALVAPATTASVAIRRRYPTLVGVGVPVISVFEHGFWNPQSVAYPIANFCALYGLAVWTTSRRFVAGLVLVAAAGLAPIAGQSPNPGGTATFYVVVEVVAMLIVRRVVGDRERRIQLAERERVVVAREAVVEERARIARELHDAIAHDVSLMVVQAGAERRVLDAEDGSTREVLETIEEIGRSSLDEMRRLVGMLRSDEGDPLSPQPGLRDLAELAAQVRAAGLPVELVVEGERRPLPAGIELSAYRIVQEALTNALKHAGAAQAVVRVRCGVDSLGLEIADDGAGTAEVPVAGGGHGLVGMRERVALYGGRLDAGRRPGGGFEVRVQLPLG